MAYLTLALRILGGSSYERIATRKRSPGAPESFVIFAQRHKHLNFVAFNAHLVGVDLQTRVVAPGAIAHVKSPGVPGASYLALFVELPSTQRSPHVRAKIVDRRVRFAAVKDSHQSVAHFKRRPLPCWDSAHFGDRHKFRHDGSSSQRMGLAWREIETT